MAAKFVAEEGILKGTVLPLENGYEWTIGRDPESCQLIIEDPSASRRHLICRRITEGIQVENLSTTNPILVNDEVVKEPRILHQGDTLRIGSCTYRFYEEEEAHIWTEEEEKEVVETPVIAEEEKIPPPKEEEPQPEPIAEPSPAEQEEKPEEPSRDSIFEEAEPGKKSPELASITFDISGSGRWLLKVVSGPNSGAEFAMQTNHTYLIGTDPNTCDIVFHDNSVSRQHARISITADDKVMIEDVGSRNGTLLDGEKLEGKRSLETNMLVTLGTSSFVVFDREGEMQTIISPLLPSIVKTLQEEKQEPITPVEEKKEEVSAEAQAAHHTRTMGAFILIAIITGVFAIAGIGITTLFTGGSALVKEEINHEKLLKQALASFPEIRYQFNKSTGNLLLIGHVLSGSDKTRLVNTVHELSFVKHVDDRNVVIDEFIWREINQAIARDPAWKGIAIHSTKAGQFVVSGYLQSRAEAERLWDYINANFPYLDLLEKRVVVEEDVIQTVNSKLELLGFNKVLVSMSNGEIILAGVIPIGTKDQMTEFVEEIKKTPGLRNVRNLTQEAAVEASVVNITDKYEVSGFSHKGTVNVGVVINGRILSVGDKLDGMTITEIGDTFIMLKKEGVIYRIDYHR